MITREEVMELGVTFWELTRQHVPVVEIEPYFINPGILVPNGELMSLEAHQSMHLGFRDETHDWRTMTVTPICDAPERVLAIGDVAWEASFTDGREGRIKSVVSETWIIERGSDGALRWTFYWSNAIALAEGSAPFES